MSQYNVAGERSFVAGADFSASKYKIVKLGSNDNEVVLASAATDKMVGILMNDPESGEIANVRLANAQGTMKVVAGGAVTKGAEVTADANGDAVATTTAGNRVLGVALEPADDGDIFEVLLTPGRVVDA